MKIRNGFVSNSSSSSYLISFNKDINLDKLFKNDNKRTYILLRGVKEVVKYIKEDWGIGIKESYIYTGTKDKINKKYQENFAHFAAIIAKIAKALDNGEDVASIIIEQGDKNSYNNLKKVTIISN